jgi:hypothetical protein
MTNKKKTIIIGICLWLAIGLLSGCIMVRNSPSDEIKGFPNPPPHPPSVKVSVGNEPFPEAGYLPGSKENMRRMNIRNLERLNHQAVNVFKESSLFSEVQAANPDLYVDIFISRPQGNESKSSSFATGWALLNLITLTAIPNIYNSTIEVKTLVTESQSGRVHEYVMQDKITTYSWILFIFALPIQGDDIEEYRYKWIINKMLEDGLLPNTQS